MRRHARPGVPRALCLAVAAVLLLASGCAGSKASDPSPPTANQTGPTTGQLAILRSVPASTPITGPRVPEIFALEDAQRLTGLKDIKITAQA